MFLPFHRRSRRLWLNAALTGGVSLIALASCTDPFSSCESTRSCPVDGGQGGDAADAAGTGGIGDPGDDAGAGGTHPDSGGAGAGGAGGDDATAGDGGGGMAGGTTDTDPGGAGGQSGDGGSGGVPPDDPCDDNPCENSGTCTVGSGAGYSCECDGPFTGQRCELPRFEVFSGAPKPYVVPNDVSADGKVVVGYMADTSRSPSTPFRWTAEQGFQALHSQEPIDSGWANAVNADGSVIVGKAFTPIGVGAFRWTETDGLVLLGAGTNSEAEAVSANGTVVAGTMDERLFRWTPGASVQDLGPFDIGTENGPIWVGGTNMSADGTVIVGRTFLSGVEAVFRWASNRFARIGSDGIRRLHPHVSADGNLIAGTYEDPQSLELGAFQWRAGVIEAIDPETLSGVNVTGISGDGSVILGNSSTQGAWIRTAEQGTRFLVDVLADQGVDSPGSLGHASISFDGSVVVGARMDGIWIARID